MTKRRTGVTLDAWARELEVTLEAAHAELANLEAENDRYRRGLLRIASGATHPAQVARDALHPPPAGEAA